MRYGKAFATAAAAVLSAVVAALLGDESISEVEWINVAVAGVGAAGVLAAPNVPGARYTKLVLAALTAVLALLVNLIADGVTGAEWAQLALAGLGAFGVWAVPNRAPAGAHAASEPPADAV